MRLRTPSIAIALALTIASGAIPSGAAPLRGADELDARAIVEEVAAVQSEAVAASPTLEHVANLKHRRANGQEMGGRGSDIEFVELDVTDLPGAPEGVEGVRRFALAGTIDLPNTNLGLQIVDVTDPTNPTPAAVWDCRVSQGDIQVLTREVDGVTRTYVGYGADYGAVTSSGCFNDLRAMGRNPGNGLGSWFADITNPYDPTTVGFVPISTGSHNLTIHPSGDYLYNSSNRIGAAIGTLEVYDISDLSSPKALPSLNLGTGIDAHDLTFSADGKRAYTAAINHTLIIDTSNPASPTIIGRVLNAAATIHHQADPVTITHPVLGKRSYLVITDEFGGAAGNGFCPGGGLIIYDITGDLERTPVFVGAWFIPQVEPVPPVGRQGRGSVGVLPACTSHVLRFHPDEALMTIGWYSAGVRVVDISSLVGASAGVLPDLGDTGQSGVGMREIGFHYFSDSNSWAAKTPEITTDDKGNRSFYLFSNDIQRGLDVYRFDESKAAGPLDGGRWMTPAQYTAFKASLASPGEVGGQPWCSLRALGQET